MNKQDKELLAQYIIETAKKHGADQVAVDISNESEIGLQYRNGEIEQLQESQQNGLSIKIYAENKYSSHSTNDLSKDAVAKFVERAVKSTKYLTADKFRELPDPKYYPENLDTDLQLRDPNYEDVTTENRLQIVKEIHDIAKAESKQIISVTAGCGDAVYSNFKALSNGFSAHKDGSIFSMGAEVTVKDKDSRPEDWRWVQSRFYNLLPDMSVIAKQAANGALDKRGQSKIKTGKYTLIVENRAATGLLSMLISPMSAASIQQKSSYMDGMIGKSIASNKLTVLDNPFIIKGLASRLYDGEGIESKKREIITNGVLQQYYIDSYYGKKLGLEPNGGSSSNLILEVGERTIEQIVADTQQGIFVTSFNGGNSNSTTGDFSFGISGFYIEKGEIVKPVSEMNISGNSKELWQNLEELGNDPYQYSQWQVPALVFGGVSCSGM